MKTKKLLIFALAALLNHVGIAAIIYVDKDAAGSNDGSSWSDAYLDLQSAIGAALNGDEIWVADGVYKPTSGIDRTIAFNITTNIELYGGFNGTETVRSERDWDTNPCRLSGQINNLATQSDNSHNILIVNATDVKIDGFIIERAYRDFAETGNVQGALRIDSCDDIDVRHCIFRNNHSYSGSAITIYYGYIDLDNCLVRDNENDAGTTVAFIFSSTGVVTNCTLTQNTWVQTYGAAIGGFVTAYCEVYNTIIWDNDGHEAFGSAPVTVDNCILDLFTITGADTFLDYLSVDPLFVNPGTNNFKLQAASPAIGYGQLSYSNLNRDLDHNYRIWDGLDAGCFEFVEDRTLYVKASAAGNSNGSTWSDAFTDLQDAISEANSGDQIWVAAGVYMPTITSDRSVYFEPKHNVPMYGGFDGTESMLSERSWTDNLTVLSGNIGALFMASDNSYHVLRINSPGGDIEVDGFVIERAFADLGPANEDNGAGFMVEQANSFVLNNCWIRENEAISSGGGGWVFNVQTTSLIHNCVFQNNIGTNGGALMYNTSVDLENCFFSQNTGTTSIVFSNTLGNNIAIRGCTFYGNTINSNFFDYIIDGTGGGVLAGQMSNSIIWGNSYFPGNSVVAADPDFDVDHCILEGATLPANQEGIEVYYEDPCFIDPASGNFALCTSSVGHDNGDGTIVTTSLDVLASPRIQGVEVDMGAVENDGSTRVIYVDTDAAGANDGSSWVDAFSDLQDALIETNCADEIWLAEGVYKPTATTDRSISFVVAGDISIYGGFNGTETSREQRNWQLHKSVLSGAIGSPVDITDNSRTILTTNVGVKSFLIDGVQFRRGYIEPNYPIYTAAILCLDGHNVFRHCTFRLNTGHAASAIYTSGVSLFMDNCLIHDNHTLIGGTVSNASSSNAIDIYNSTFANNTHVESYAAEIGSYAATELNVYNSIFWGNTSASISGSGSENVQNCLIEGGYLLGINITDEDPLFTDPVGDDFTLLPGSPAFDAGIDALPHVNLDLNLQPRIWNNQVDLGCFEFYTTDIIYANDDASGANDGSSWSNAYTDLQSALGSFTGVEEIWVAAGDYPPTATNDRSISFNLVSGIEIYGGFIGVESLRSQRDPVNACNLTGEIGDPADPSDNSLHIINATSINSVILDGLRIRDGYAHDPAPNNQGAAIFVDDSQLHLVNCALTGNDAAIAGAISMKGSSDLILDACLMNSNHAGSTACILAPGSCTITLTNSSLQNNTSDLSCAGIGTHGPLSVSNCSFLNNQSGTSGGPLQLNSPDLSIDGCLFEGNSANSIAGALAIDAGSVGTVSNCIFRDNSSMTLGGAIYSSATGVMLEGCLFTGNQAEDGAAVFAQVTSVTDMINCTVTGNTSTGAFPNASVLLSGSASLFYNNIIWNNTADVSMDESPGITPTNCIVEGGVTGVNIWDCDPLFTDPGSDDFSISAHSPAFNMGDQSAVSLAEDLSGNPRIEFGDVDLGAYESTTCSQPNDECNGAVELVVGAEPQFGSLNCATTGIGDTTPSCLVSDGRTVWFSFNAPAGGSVDVATSDVEMHTPVFNMRMALYGGVCGALTELTCEDAFSDESPESLSTAGLVPGETYYVRVDGVGTQEATFKIKVEATSVSCSGDFDSNGVIDTSDLLTFLAQFGCLSGCTTDMNGDTVVDTSDLLLFLAVFGSNC